MKARSIKYLAAEGVKNIWANRLMSIASIGVLIACMVLIGMASLITKNVNKAISTLEQQNVIMAYFNDKNSVLYGENAPAQTDENVSVAEDSFLIHNDEEAKALCDKLSEIDNVLSVEYISSEAGLQSVKDTLLEGKEEYFTFLDEEYGNPLSAAAKITLADMSKFSETLSLIEATEGVDSVQSQSDLADKINAIKTGVGVAGVWIIAILLIISLVIVSNTIRVTMYSRKLEIGIMKAVGATDSFIRLPFVIEGMFIGVISAIFSMAIVYFCYRVATETLMQSLGVMEIIKFSSVALETFGIFVIIGLVSGALGSLFMISKYLKKEGSEFTAI
ncbi:MAG: ABC transporter permease [Clostridia bacterium]|nr:ABC transporter permease [Clostridia bacterium]